MEKENLIYFVFALAFPVASIINLMGIFR